MILEIAVPNVNDSFSRVVLDGEQYAIRFTWNMFANRWSFGLYTVQHEPIVVGIRIVPHFPLNLQLRDSSLPNGVFGVYTEHDEVGRMDFVNGKARFVFVQNEEA